MDLYNLSSTQSFNTNIIDDPKNYQTADNLIFFLIW